jgi:N-succinyl-L-ornithine transcarbamylase
LDKDKDNAETVMAGFLKYATVPVVNMEGAPVTHYNPLPMRLPWKSSKQNTDQRSFYPGHHTQKLCLRLSPILRGNDAIARRRFCHYTSLRTQSEITKDSKIVDQNKAFENADFIYTKNWSSYKDYGKITNND